MELLEGGVRRQKGRGVGGGSFRGRGGTVPGMWRTPWPQQGHVGRAVERQHLRHRRPALLRLRPAVEPAASAAVCPQGEESPGKVFKEKGGHKFGTHHLKDGPDGKAWWGGGTLNERGGLKRGWGWGMEEAPHTNPTLM